MILLSKDEKDMSKEELIKLDIMKTIAEGKGYQLNGPTQLNFQEGSTFDKVASGLLSKFDITPKGQKKEAAPKPPKAKSEKPKAGGK